MKFAGIFRIFLKPANLTLLNRGSARIAYFLGNLLPSDKTPYLEAQK
jgi:hypothetical protein